MGTNLHEVFSIERQMVEFDDKTLKIEQLEIQGPPTAFHFSSNVEQCFHNLNLLWPCCLQAQNWPTLGSPLTLWHLRALFLKHKH